MAEIDKDVHLVLKRWEKADRALIEERRNFWLNSSFFEGYQWVAWDNKTNSVVNFTQLNGGDDSRVRIKINKIQERINQLMGRFLQRTLSFEGQPNNADDATIQGARLSEAVLEAAHIEQDWEAVREDETFGALMGGTSAVGIDWDPDATPIAEDAKGGQVTNTGEVRLTSYSISEFSVEPGSRSWHDAHWWVSGRAQPPAQIKAKYQLDWMPQPDAMGAYSPLQREISMGRRQSNEKDLSVVHTLYERPNPGCKKGRHIVVVNERIVTNEPWPFPFEDHLNLWCFRQVKVPMRWTGVTIASEARGPQIAYNAVRSAIIEVAKMSGNPRMLVPSGAFDDETELTDEAGEILRYWPDSVTGAKPEWMMSPEIPRWLQQEPDRLEAELDGILHTHAVSRGEAPGDRNSGLALSILAEKNDTPLGPMSHDQAQGWSAIGTMVLKIYEAKVKQARTVVKTGESGVPHTFEWDGKRLQGQTRVIVPADATLPTSKAASQAMLTQLAQAFPQLAQAMTVPMLTKLLEVPGSKIMSQIADPDVAWSHRENEFLAAEEPRIPMPWEDHAVHIAEHNAFRKTKAFDSASDAVKQIFEAHITAHQRLIEEEAVQQGQLNAVNPGFAGLPQGNEPIGSAVPPSYAEQQASNVSPIGGAPAA